jgi:hypothetical protein
MGGGGGTVRFNILHRNLHKTLELNRHFLKHREVLAAVSRSKDHVIRHMGDKVDTTAGLGTVMARTKTSTRAGIEPRRRTVGPGFRYIRRCDHAITARPRAELWPGLARHGLPWADSLSL